MKCPVPYGCAIVFLLSGGDTTLLPRMDSCDGYTEHFSIFHVNVVSYKYLVMCSF